MPRVPTTSLCCTREVKRSDVRSGGPLEGDATCLIFPWPSSINVDVVYRVYYHAADPRRSHSVRATAVHFRLPSSAITYPALVLADFHMIRSVRFSWRTRISADRVLKYYRQQWRSWRACGAWAPSSGTPTSCSASTYVVTPCAPIASKWRSWKVQYNIFTWIVLVILVWYSATRGW